MATWTPQIGSSWYIQLQDTIDYSNPSIIYHSDLVNNFQIEKVHKMGKKAICYINGELRRVITGVHLFFFLSGWEC
jgi:hypothetical protein